VCALQQCPIDLVRADGHDKRLGEDHDNNQFKPYTDNIQKRHFDTAVVRSAEKSPYAQPNDDGSELDEELDREKNEEQFVDVRTTQDVDEK